VQFYIEFKQMCTNLNCMTMDKLYQAGATPFRRSHAPRTWFHTF